MKFVNIDLFAIMSLVILWEEDYINNRDIC